MGERFVDLIYRKKQGGKLSENEIKQMIGDYVKGEIPDYQMSAMLMAICFQGMDSEELSYLTFAMRDSGETVDLSSIKGIKVDKHSTGGVGDKTTLIVGPMVAAAGIPVAKMSGRGLGFTGGTIDKLESIPGFCTDLSGDKFFDAVNKVGICVAGQNADLAPADKLLYALRDVTGTVDSIPLIAASIMSKKLAAGSDKILLDVTTGSGAFIHDIQGSTQLAECMVSIGTHAGKETVALITDMDEPLGFAVGNNLEVKEAIDALKGNGPADLMEVCLALASNMIFLAKEGAVTLERAEEIARQTIEDGSAFKKFEEMVADQGGDVSYIDDPSKFEAATFEKPLLAKASGYIDSMNTANIGIASGMLGAGRTTKDSPIDFGAGILWKKKVGDAVQKGETIATLYSEKQDFLNDTKTYLQNNYTIANEKPAPRKLIHKRVVSEKVLSNNL